MSSGKNNKITPEPASSPPKSPPKTPVSGRRLSLKESESGASPKWLNPRLSSRRASDFDAGDTDDEDGCEDDDPVDVPKTPVTHKGRRCSRLSVPDRPMRTLRALPKHLEDDQYTATAFDWAKTQGISKKPVGEGCQAIVYSVQRPGDNGQMERFAIKVLRERLASDPVEMRAFQREVNLLARLDHEHVCAFVAVGTTPFNGPCVMLEYVSKNVTRSLRLGDVQASKQIKADVEQRWPARARLKLMTELADAMKYLHHHALEGCVVLHRDIKPDNVGLDPNGVVKLLDFGLAVCLLKDAADDRPLCHIKYQLSGQTGSARYMSPECGRGDPYGAASDVYGFAVMAWEVLVLSGKPYAGMNVDSHKEAVIYGSFRPPIPKDMHPDLQALIADAWQSDQSKRPDFQAVHEILKTRLLDVSSDDPLRKPASKTRRRRCTWCA